MSGRVKAGALIVLAAVIALAPPVRAAAPVNLIDQRGHAFTLDSLRGKPLVVTFVAAHCTEACPLINAQFAQAQEIFAREHLDVRLLTITLDPQHDPPSVMRALANRFSADPNRWIVASGSVRNVQTVMNAFGVVAQQGRKGYADVHTTFVYIFNKHGVLVQRVFASTAMGSQLADDLKSKWKVLAQ